MGLLDAPARQFRSTETINGYGHSYTQICVQQPSTTLATACQAGQAYFDVNATTAIQVNHNYTLCRAGDYQNGENVWVRSISGSTVTLDTPLTLDKAAGDLFIDHSFMCLRRFAKMIGAPPQFTNRGVGGAVLVQGGSPTTAGGFNAVFQLHPKPPGVYGDPSPGVNTYIIGLNDLATSKITSAGGGQTGINNIVEAGRHAYRACQARFNLCLLYEAETAFPATAINTTFAGSGSWTSPTGTTYNSGTGWRQNVSSGATITHALPESATASGVTSRIIDFCFLGDISGGTTVPGSTIDFTIDGTPVYPIGGNSAGAYSATNKFRTDAQQATGMSTPVPCVARFATDGAAHSIVATSNTGGMALDWIGYEAEYCSPTIMVNVCVTPGATSTATATAIPYWNAMLSSVVSEFNSPLIQIADIYSVLSPGGTYNIRCWNTFLDTTHPNTYGNGLIAQEMYKAYNRMGLTNLSAADL